MDGLALVQPVPDPDRAMRNFERALRRIGKMSKEDLDGILEQEKAARAGQPRRKAGRQPGKASARVSSDKG